MADLPATPFTVLTEERTDADSPLDESLVVDIGVDLNFLKAGVDSLQANVTTLQVDVQALQVEVTTLQAEMITVQADVTTLQADQTGGRVLSWVAM